MPRTLVALAMSAIALLALASSAFAATYRVLASPTSSRANAVPLDGTTKSGNMYVFTDTDSSVRQVEFLVDGVSKRVERIAPHDLAGTAGDGGSLPFDTKSLSDGQHRVTARVTPSSGSTYDITATFNVRNRSYRLLVSGSSSRANAVALDGTTQSGNAYVFTDTDSAVQQVEFLVDGVSKRVERIAPHDLAGTAGDGGSLPFDTKSLSDGQHRFTARVTPASGSAYDLNANVTVHNTSDTASGSSGSSTTYPARLYGLNGVPGWSAWDEAKSIGATVLRWEFIYTDNPASYDAQFTAAAQRGQMLLPLILGPGNKYTTNYTALANYTSAVSARYGPGGSYWRAHPEFSASLAPRYFEVWNEPYGNWYDRVDPPAYVKMLKAIVDAGRKANPASRFLLPATALPGFTDGRGTWIDDLYKAEPNLNNWFDGIAAHPYAGSRAPDDPGMGMNTQLNNIESRFAAHGAGSKPVWITEIGWGTCTGSSSCVSESTQAAYYSKMFSLLKSRPEVTGLLTYNYRGSDQNQSSPEGFYGLDHFDGSHKPAWSAYKAGATAG
jgi:hypothetical protein